MPAAIEGRSRLTLQGPERPLALEPRARSNDNPPGGASRIFGAVEGRLIRWARVGLVVAGYAAAFAAAGVAGWLYDLQLAKLPYDTSGGMYAGGEMLWMSAVFLVVALGPTLLALWFLRRHERAWNALATAALVFAVAGLLAVLLPLVAPGAPTSAALVLMGLLGLSQLLGVPLWTAAFALFAWLAPSRRSRRTLFAAVAVELVIAACAALHWFLPFPLF